MKYNKTLTLIISFIPFIIIILYYIFRYYLRTEYKLNVNHETLLITVLITSFFWVYGFYPILNKFFSKRTKKQN